MKTKILLFVLLALFACTLPVFGGDDAEAITIVTPAPTLSPIELYDQAVEQDKNTIIEASIAVAETNGSPDYSDMGYASCSGDYDCLVGEQTCKAGIVPSSNSMMPGYCVPNDLP